MDPDHRLLLRNAKPLLQSRSAAVSPTPCPTPPLPVTWLLQVVMAVAQMYHHIAPHNELSIIAKPLIRLLKSYSEVQSVVLSNIATISAARPVSQ